MAVDHGDEQPPQRQRPLRPVPGTRPQTLAYYRDEVAPFVAERYRVLSGREHTATCGSSLGGLFSIYIAWQHSDFARHHAALSTSFWATATWPASWRPSNACARAPRRNIRLWLDSGTLSSPGRGDDGQRETARPADALLEAGYVEGVTSRIYVAEGATHSEGVVGGAGCRWCCSFCFRRRANQTSFPELDGLEMSFLRKK